MQHITKLTNWPYIDNSSNNIQLDIALKKGKPSVNKKNFKM